MPSAPNTFWEKLKASTWFVKSFFTDKKVSEEGVETMIGDGFLDLQVSVSEQKGTYIVLKSRGGEATVYVPLSLSQAATLSRRLADLAAKHS